MSPEVAAEVAEHATDEALTAREIDVLRLIAAGNANKEIAAQLSITEETVKGRVRNILAKLARERPDPRRHDRVEARNHRVRRAGLRAPMASYARLRWHGCQFGRSACATSLLARKSDRTTLSGLSNEAAIPLTSIRESCATAIFYFCERPAWHRPAVDPAGCRHYINWAWGYGTVG